MRQVSHAANYSRIWIGAAGLLAVAGGDSGRRAAFEGIASIAVTSVVVNAALKPLGRRRRPERGPLLARHVRMPESRSFPSGHAASAFAFATGVAATQPALALPLRSARRSRGLLARAHGSPFPRRVAGRISARRLARAGHHPRARAASGLNEPFDLLQRESRSTSRRPYADVLGPATLAARLLSSSWKLRPTAAAPAGA